jgi:hypothetical protein
MSKREKPSLIIVFWDDSDPNNEGWSFRAYWYGDDGRKEHEESGGVEGRSSLSHDTLMRRARAAAGWPGTRITVEVR